MAYTPNPTDVTQPVESVLAQTAAAEFRALKAYIQTIVSGGGLGVATPGQISMFAGSAPLAGWLVCDGSLVLRSTYPNLLNAAIALGAVVTEAAWLGGNIGSFSGGDLSTTFRLPDLRGVFPRGWNQGKAGAYFDPGRAQGQIQLTTVIGDNGGNGTTIVAVQSGLNIGNPDVTDFMAATYGTVSPTSGGGSNVIVRGVRPTNVPLMFCVKT